MHGARRARDDRVMQRKNMQRTSATLYFARTTLRACKTQYSARTTLRACATLFRARDLSGPRDAVAATVIENGRSLPRGIPFIPLNPAESRMKIILLLASCVRAR